jgi:hypothetical protein
MNDVIKNEPAVTVSAVTALIASSTGLLVAFNINITEAQQDAIVAFSLASFPFILLLGGVIRGLVSPAAKVDEAFVEGLETAQSDAVEVRPPSGGSANFPPGEGGARFTSVQR